MHYTPIIGTLGFVLSPDRQQTLLVHRTSRVHDPHFGKFNGLGGKMRAGEDVVACMKREILEESGLICLQMALRGTISWPGFGANGEDWLGFIFRIDRFSGVPYCENEEGPLAWRLISGLAELPMWEGDRHFLPLIFDQDPRAFHGVMPYVDGRPVSWSYSRI
ncbi:MAG: 8-oxo-dGTP diphosphatase [Proteobacteria bacterium]|nr:8-oxo-dGTP diphosphatase [Desulfobulbaceae bacterium]MBU4153489.1 8-oxo-dGTP diphosphatase [Pseudomonadota bacterium]MDP2106605.1 8-oxo-dGTP diphosphatase [Desulfobulbaceae bacterium]